MSAAIIGSNDLNLIPRIIGSVFYDCHQYKFLVVYIYKRFVDLQTNR